MVTKKRGLNRTRLLCKRLRVPNYIQELAELTCKYHTHVHKALELRPETVVNSLITFDVWRKLSDLRNFYWYVYLILADERALKIKNIRKLITSKHFIKLL